MKNARENKSSFYQYCIVNNGVTELDQLNSNLEDGVAGLKEKLDDLSDNLNSKIEPKIEQVKSEVEKSIKEAQFRFEKKMTREIFVAKNELGRMRNDLNFKVDKIIDLLEHGKDDFSNQSQGSLSLDKLGLRMCS